MWAGPQGLGQGVLSGRKAARWRPPRGVGITVSHEGHPLVVAGIEETEIVMPVHSVLMLVVAGPSTSKG